MSLIILCMKFSQSFFRLKFGLDEDIESEKEKRKLK